MKMAKSPNSWGNSCSRMAMEVERPVRKEAEKAAPMAMPSTKLWIPSPINTNHTTVGMPGQGDGEGWVDILGSERK